MYSALNDAALPASGLPIRRSAGQCLFSDSPRLIAAVHVLLRLLVPRHPPCALNILTVRRPVRTNTRRPLFINPYSLVQFSRSTEAHAAEVFRRRSLKTEQRSGDRSTPKGASR